MLNLENINFIVVILISIVIIVCSIGIIIASRFQIKQKKKYNECLRLVKEKDNQTIEIRDGLTKEEINNIDSEVNVDSLMSELYNTYLSFENKIKTLDENLDDVLTGFMKDLYRNKINTFKSTGYSEINDNIDLMGYSITEFNKEKLKFRINVNCYNYKKSGTNIVSGSNLEKVNQILLLTYEKIDNRWLISDYDKIYEKKLSN